MTKEIDLQKSIMLSVGMHRHHVRLFRNNVGACKTADGRFIKFGLIEGSSDLIGWSSMVITPSMVGSKIAVFSAVEVKGPTGKTTEEQDKWLRAVNAAGGIAIVARSTDDVLKCF